MGCENEGRSRNMDFWRTSCNMFLKRSGEGWAVFYSVVFKLWSFLRTVDGTCLVFQALRRDPA